MPTFGPGSLVDIILLVAFLGFMSLSSRVGLSKAIAGGICLVAAGLLAFVTRCVSFRHITYYRGKEALAIGGFYIALGCILFAVHVFRRHRQKDQKGTEIK